MRSLQATMPRSPPQDESSSMMSSESTSSTSHTPGAILALSMTLVFAVLVLVPVCAIGESRRRRRRRRLLDHQAGAASESRGRRGGGATTLASSDDDEELRRAWERRYHTVEGWIVTKHAHEHDDICQALTAPRGARAAQAVDPVTVPNTTCVEADRVNDDVECGSESGDRECPICFERLEAGDLLSWSAGPRCDHVFHHGCIKEWLLDRKDCPYCRTVFLPVDAFGTSEAMAAHIPDLILGQKRRCAPCFYCLEHQVVRLPSSTQLDAMNLAPVLRRQVEDRCAHVPDRTALTAIRRRIQLGTGDDTDPTTDSGDVSSAVVVMAQDGGGDRSNSDATGSNAPELPSELCHAAADCPDDETSVRQCLPTAQELEYMESLNVDRPTLGGHGPSTDPCRPQDDDQGGV